MRDPNIGWIEEKLRHRRVRYGLTAAAVSVVLHVLLVARFPEFTFGGIVRVVQRKYFPAVRVERVRAEEDVTAARPARFRPENPNISVDFPAEANALRRGLEEVLVEPRLLPQDILAGETKVVGQPTVTARSAWDPRREIVKIEKKICDDSLSAFPRRYVASSRRASRTADITAPVDRPRPEDLAGGEVEDFLRPGSPEGKDTTVVLGGTGGAKPLPKDVTEPAQRLVSEAPKPVVGLEAIERLLVADVRTYRTFRDLKNAYCRIEIRRKGPEELPVLPKDILLVQDCSASMAELRLQFCREGLPRCLSQIGPEDRFNVVAFRDRAEKCFPTWVTRSPATVEEAARFIGAMRSAGNTDIYGSIRELLDLDRVPGRPAVALVVSDGVPTVGETSSSKIIAEFSRDNQGALSVITLGTSKAANQYLLDLLSYCNRGDSLIITRGRWDIPDAIEKRALEIARPVLTDVRFQFARARECEAYPEQTANLYLDRNLVLFGRYPRDMQRLVFRAAGRAGEKRCDMVFNVDLERAASSSEDLCQQWAWQKSYHLIAEHTRTRDPALLEELRRLSRAYGIRTPYADALGE
jgi:hypothetical protein